MLYQFRIDTLLHFCACLLIATLLYPLIGWWSMGAAIVAGIAKEAYDYYDYGHFSLHDILADIAGTAVSIPFCLIIKAIIQ